MKLFDAPNMAPELDAVVDSEALAATRGTIFDIQRFSVNDGPGIRTIVFLKSCPLHCAWCANPESQSASPELMYARANCLQCGDCVKICLEKALTLRDNEIVIDRTRCTACGDCVDVCPTNALRIAGRVVTAGDVLREVERDTPFYSNNGGMTLSGGETLQQPEFALALLQLARARGIHTTVETCGWSNVENTARVLSQSDLILFDLKHWDAQAHADATGKSNARILENAMVASKLGVPMILRTPVIPNFNDTIADMTVIGKMARAWGLREMHLLPYHTYGVPKYAALDRAYTLPNPSVAPARLQEIQNALEQLGLSVQVGG